MGFRVNIKGAENIELGEVSVTSVKFSADTPNDSKARSSDCGATLFIAGKIRTVLDGAATDETIKVAKWAQVPAESSDSYRDITAQVISAGQVVREYKLPRAFCVDYTERYGDNTGTGTFTLEVKEKKDQMNLLAFAGGYAL
jgi:hypothetical protein